MTIYNVLWESNRKGVREIDVLSFSNSTAAEQFLTVNYMDLLHNIYDLYAHPYFIEEAEKSVLINSENGEYYDNIWIEETELITE